MTGKREIKLGGEILSGCGLEYYWQNPYKENGNYYQNLLINTVRLDIDSLRLAFDDSTTLKIWYTTLRITDQGNLARLEDQFETIFCSNNMVANAEAVANINSEKEELQTREVRFKICLNPSNELARCELEERYNNINNNVT